MNRMSHIDNALIKAQKERDGRDTRYSPVMPVSSATDTSRRRWWQIVAAAVAVAGLCAGLAFFAFQNRPLSAEKGLPPAPYRDTTVQREEPSAQETSPQAPPQAKGEKEVHPVTEGGGSTQLATIEPHTTSRPEPVISRQQTPNTARTDTLYNRAMAYQKEGLVDRAEEIYKEILEIVPGHLFSLNNLGVIQMLRENDDVAAELFQRAIRAKGDYVDPHYNLACLCARRGDTVPALEHLERAVRLNNDVKKWAKDDRDLSSLRGSAGYARVMGEPSTSTQTDLPVHIVREGDRIYDVIRKEFGSSGNEAYQILKLIKQLNPSMKDSNMIFPGQKVQLPDKREVITIASPPGDTPYGE